MKPLSKQDSTLGQCEATQNLKQGCNTMSFMFKKIPLTLRNEWVTVRQARTGESPMSIVMSSWERTWWFGLSGAARETWTDGGHVWDNIAFACLLPSSFPFLLTFMNFSIFRKPQDHVPKIQGTTVIKLPYMEMEIFSSGF